MADPTHDQGGPGARRGLPGPLSGRFSGRLERLDVEESLGDVEANTDDTLPGDGDDTGFSGLRLVEDDSGDDETARSTETDDDGSFDDLELRDEPEDDGDAKAGGAEQ